MFWDNLSNNKVFMISGFVCLIACFAVIVFFTPSVILFCYVQYLKRCGFFTVKTSSKFNFPCQFFYNQKLFQVYLFFLSVLLQSKPLPSLSVFPVCSFTVKTSSKFICFPVLGPGGTKQEMKCASHQFAFCCELSDILQYIFLSKHIPKNTVSSDILQYNIFNHSEKRMSVSVGILHYFTLQPLQKRHFSCSTPPSSPPPQKELSFQRFCITPCPGLTLRPKRLSLQRLCRSLQKTRLSEYRK